MIRPRNPLFSRPLDFDRACRNGHQSWHLQRLRLTHVSRVQATRLLSRLCSRLSTLYLLQHRSRQESRSPANWHGDELVLAAGPQRGRQLTTTWDAGVTGIRRRALGAAAPDQGVEAAGRRFRREFLGALRQRRGSLPPASWWGSRLMCGGIEARRRLQERWPRPPATGRSGGSYSR